MKRVHTMNGIEKLAIFMTSIVSLIAIVILVSIPDPEVPAQEPEIQVTPVVHTAESNHVVVVEEEKPVEETEPVVSTWREAITQEEAEMLAQTMYNESQVLIWNGDKNGMSYMGRQAAVAWCALNRLDSGRYGSTLKEVLTAPNQFAWDPNTEVTEHMKWLTEDVLDRWWAEKHGVENVGRTLPGDYFFFAGYNNENYFRKDYGSSAEWNWDIHDPYGEMA